MLRIEIKVFTRCIFFWRYRCRILVAGRLRLRIRFVEVGFALKDRAAVLLGGKEPDGCYWFDIWTGKFMTSTYYRQQPPSPPPPVP